MIKRNFQPDYTHIVDAAYNRPTTRLPLYEHNISPLVMEQILGYEFISLLDGDASDQEEYFSIYAGFCKDHGYDVVPFEGCVTELIQGGKGLCGRCPAIIRDTKDIERFPWEETVEAYEKRFFPQFGALERAMPIGMKAVGGVGNGVFETIQDFVPLVDLSYLEQDDPDTFSLLFQKVGDLLVAIWQRFLARFSDTWCLCRFGDDLGFKTSTLIHPDTIRSLLLPQYARIIHLVHKAGRPFLLHNCGAVFSVMEDLIQLGIDAKHSNEDNIAPFSTWVDRYGDRIGNFGGIDMNILCLSDTQTVHEYVLRIIRENSEKPGIAIGSGNQIADYVLPESFLTMVETVETCRAESNARN